MPEKGLAEAQEWVHAPSLNILLLLLVTRVRALGIVSVKRTEKQCCICICKVGFTDVLLLYLSCWYPCFFSVKQEDSAHDSTLKIVKIDKYALFACNRYTRTVRRIISNIDHNKVYENCRYFAQSLRRRTSELFKSVYHERHVLIKWKLDRHHPRVATAHSCLSCLIHGRVAEVGRVSCLELVRAPNATASVQSAKTALHYTLFLQLTASICNWCTQHVTMWSVLPARR